LEKNKLNKMGSRL